MIRETPLRAGAKEYTFRLGANAICRFEQEAGIGVGKFAMQFDPKAIEFRVVRAMVWAGLKDRHPEMTLTLAGEVIDEVGAGNIMNLLESAFIASFPPPDKNANPQMAAGGNGLHS